MNMSDFSVKSDKLGKNFEKDAKVLLARRDEVLDDLAEHGMHEDDEVPYAYYVPTGLFFDCGRGKDCQITSIAAVVVMARASYAAAHYLDCDKEGFPELWQFTTKGKKGFHRIYVTDPFAMHLDAAIQRNKERLLKNGEARIVNGKFYKVA